MVGFAACMDAVWVLYEELSWEGPGHFTGDYETSIEPDVDDIILESCVEAKQQAITRSSCPN